MQYRRTAAGGPRIAAIPPIPLLINVEIKKISLRSIALTLFDVVKIFTVHESLLHITAAINTLHRHADSFIFCLLGDHLSQKPLVQPE